MNRQRTELTRDWGTTRDWFFARACVAGAWMVLLFAASIALSNMALAAESDEQQPAAVVEVQVDVEVEAEATCESKPAAAAKSTGSWLSILIPGLSESSTDVSADSPEFAATHSQVALLKVERSDADNKKNNPEHHGAAWAVRSFCLDRDDNLLVAVSNLYEGELQLLSPAGERLQTWKTPVAPEAINVDPDGNFLVAGEGRMFKLDSQGKVLLEGESPLIAEMNENKDAMREQVIKQMKAQANSMKILTTSYQKRIDDIVAKSVKRLDKDDQAEYKLLQKRIKQLEAKEGEELTAEEQNAWALRKVLFRMLEAKVEQGLKPQEVKMRDLFTTQLKQFASMAALQGSEEPTDEQIEQTMQGMMGQKSKFASISAAGGDIFVATGAMEGYGYDVWSFDETFSNAEKVVSGLRGCCGQMDVQASEAGLFVAENSRHQVRHFDLKGEKLNEWGGREREGVRGFGSCCNPMNVAFGPDGTVYTAESNSGRIKRYSAEGELMELVGSVELVPGCKKVSIAVSKDHKRVYMLDITRNHIIVMEAKSEEQQVVSNDAVNNES